ncbi:MAG: hypothetical protein IJJ26_12565 [Victivallales bacterium]|nr:hypothetical protein [Victivallales bacterium]
MRRLKKKSYSEEIAEVVKEFFHSIDWKYDFDEEKGVFTYGVTIDAKVPHVECSLRVNEDSVHVRARIRLNADKQVRPQISEFLHMLNFGLLEGCFLFDPHDGEIGFRTSYYCGSEIPSIEQIHHVISHPCNMFEHFQTAILSVLFGMLTPDKALEQIENHRSTG